MTKITSQQRLIFILMLGLAMCLQPFSIDPYLASYSAITKDFDVTAALIQYSMTGVTMGFALGQILAGTLSDAYGRRRPMLVALALYAIGAAAMLVAPNIQAFIGFRLIMAMGASAAGVLGAAIVRDLYQGMPMMKMLSRVYLVQGLSPILGPLIGAQLATMVNWRTIFAIFAGFGLVVMVLALVFLRETLHVDERKTQVLRSMVGRFGAVLKDRIYVGLLLFSVLQTIALFAYLNVVPFLFRGRFELDQAQFGLFFATNSALSVIGVQLGAKLAQKIAAQWVLVGAISVSAVACAGLIVLGALDAPFWAVDLCFAVWVLGFGTTITPLQTIALTPHGSEAGTAASLMGVANFAITSLVSPVFTLLPLTTSLPVGVVMFLAYALSLASLMFIVRPRQVPKLSQ